MAWKFVPSDEFDLDQLYKWEKFYQSDLEAASKHVAEITIKARKLRLSGEGVNQMVKQANKGIKETQHNLESVQKAIAIAENRLKPKKPESLKEEPKVEETPEESHAWDEIVETHVEEEALEDDDYLAHKED